MKKICAYALAAGLLSAVAVADTVQLKPDHPDRYVVQKGDTLWDISARFLTEPWQWPEIWEVNPQIENPHLIFPGDEVALRFVDGRPVVTVTRSPVRERGGTIKLSPRVRVSDLETAVPTIPIDIIQQFLKRPRVVSEQQIEGAPYVVSVGREALIGKPGKKIYVRGLDEEDAFRYTVYRKGQEYLDPERNNESLGFEAIHIADAELQVSGDPATFMVTSAQRELLSGDRLLPDVEEEINTSFMPRAPGKDVSGQIISVLEGVSQIGQFQVVVLNLGTEDGIETGHVLAVYQRGETIEDPYHQQAQIARKAKRSEASKQGTMTGFLSSADHEVVDTSDRMVDPSRGKAKDQVKLPDERAGVVMVFRPFDRVSYALVMEATRAMHVFDMVRNP